MNEITLTEVRATKLAKSGNDRLDTLSEQIMSEMGKASALYTEVKAKTEAYARACAPLFGEIKRDKLYEKGGFKSLEEYAAQFGIQKSTAYTWARVGERFFLTDEEYTRTIRDTLTVSNMAELINSDRIAAAKAIEEGEINENTPQATIREFASSHKLPGKGGKEKVVPTFNVFFMTPGGDKSPVIENAIKDDMYNAVAQSLAANGYAESEDAVSFTTVKLEGDKPSASQHFIAYTREGFTRMYEFVPYTPKRSTVSKKGKDVSSLRDMLKAMTPEERLAFLAEIDGSAE